MCLSSDYSIYYRLIFILFSPLIFLKVGATTVSNIWLPISYQSYYPQIIEAAEKVRSINECKYLLNGTLSEKRSTKEELVFTFRCRSKEKKTFIVNVDLNSMEVSYIIDSWHRQNAFKQQEKIRKKIEKNEKYWAVCEQSFNKKTISFIELEITTPLPIEPEISVEGILTYYIEFQSLSLTKRPLFYLATAVIKTLKSCEINIRPAQSIKFRYKIE